MTRITYCLNEDSGASFHRPLLRPGRSRAERTARSRYRRGEFNFGRDRFAVERANITVAGQWTGVACGTGHLVNPGLAVRQASTPTRYFRAIWLPGGNASAMSFI